MSLTNSLSANLRFSVFCYSKQCHKYCIYLLLCFLKMTAVYGWPNFTHLSKGGGGGRGGGGVCLCVCVCFSGYYLYTDEEYIYATNSGWIHSNCWLLSFCLTYNNFCHFYHHLSEVCFYHYWALPLVIFVYSNIILQFSFHFLATIRHFNSVSVVCLSHGLLVLLHVYILNFIHKSFIFQLSRFIVFTFCYISRVASHNLARIDFKSWRFIHSIYPHKYVCVYTYFFSAEPSNVL